MSVARAALVGLLLVPLVAGCGAGRRAARELSRQKGVAEVLRVVAVGPRSGHAQGVKLPGAAWQALRPALPLPSGTLLRTARGVRVQVVMSDGTLLHVNEGSELLLEGANALQVRSGELWAEILPGGGRPVTFKTHAGQVVAHGSKLDLRVAAGSTRLEVARGVAEAANARGRVEVGAGEVAEMRREEAPRIRPSEDLAGATRWAREGGAMHPSAQQLRPGIGSLTARVARHGRPHALQLASQVVRVRIADSMATTELEQTYYNNSSNVLEGSLRFPLPGGATLARVAVQVGARLEEGELIERRRVRPGQRHALEDTIRPRVPFRQGAAHHRSVKVRILPVAPRAFRRVLLVYTEALRGVHERYEYVYPFAAERGAGGSIGYFSVDVELRHRRGIGAVATPLYAVSTERKGDQVHLRYAARAFLPTASVVVNFETARKGPELELLVQEPEGGRRGGCALPRKEGEGEATQRGDPCGDRGGYFVAALRPQIPAAGAPVRRDYLLLMDSSYSTGKQGWALQVAALQALLAEMDLRSRFAVLACDARCRGWARGFRHPTAQARRDALAFIRSVGPAGATDLQEAFVAVAAAIRGRSTPTHVIYLGDGRPSAGELRDGPLAQWVLDALTPHGATLSALRIGPEEGDAWLREATRRLGGTLHRLGPGDDVPNRIFDLLATHYRPALRGVEVSFHGVPVHRVFPEQLPAVPSGGEVLLVGRYSSPGDLQVRVRGTIGEEVLDKTFTMRLGSEAGGRRSARLGARLWAQHYVEALAADDYAHNRPEIVRASRAYQVPSRATAVVIVENERQHREVLAARRRERGLGGTDARRRPGGEERDGAGDPDGEETPFEEPPDLAGRLGGEVSGAAAAAQESGGSRPRRPVVTLRVEQAPVGGVAPSPEEVRLRRAVTAQPLRRSLRLAYHRQLVRLGRYEEALRHARSWAEIDGSGAEAVRALAESEAAALDQPRALRTYASLAELHPSSHRLQRALAEMYRRKGDLGRSCSHRWSVLALQPQQAAARTELARCLVARRLSRTEASRLLGRALGWSPPDDGVDPRVERLLDEADEEEGGGAPALPSGTLVVSATWKVGQDLDLAIVTPSGQRITPLFVLRSGTVLADSVDGSTPEVLRLATLQDGIYRIEVASGHPGASPAAAGVVAVRAGAQRRDFPFTLTSPIQAIAQVRQSRSWVPLQAPVP
ncbi:MAG: FecR domain-containing protein [Deltaproteobacteria bacterium]|nr:FecR domain-containing protein [Deltaproteobacteria bacterium]